MSNSRWEEEKDTKNLTWGAVVEGRRKGGDGATNSAGETDCLSIPKESKNFRIPRKKKLGGRKSRTGN